MHSFRADRRSAALAAVVDALVLACSPATKPVTCPTGQTACGGICFDLQANPLSCGTCLHRCPNGATCEAGVCACPTGQTACPGVPEFCVDLSTDNFRCGDCATPCGAGTCTGGACICDAGTTTCSGPGVRCADTSADAGNCGSCRYGCPAGENCVGGGCACLWPRIVCNGVCIDSGTDLHNCGACGVTCATGATCASGGCGCPTGQVVCGSPGRCTNLAIETANCGTCGHGCAAGQRCSAGVCGACPAATPDLCGASPGTCVSKVTDRANCGACGHACLVGQVCTYGTCCAPGQLACGTGAATMCCSGTSCCGSSCQPAHSNGLGQTYYDCGALGTYTHATALAAAEAWPATRVQDYDLFFSGSCFARQTSSACATWCYDGTFAGKVQLNTISTACLSPDTTSPSWN